MPRVEVLSEVPGADRGVVLSEHVPSGMFADEYYAERLVERIGRAFLDAERHEQQSTRATDVGQAASHQRGPPPMDDRHAQFMIVMADACCGAALAGLVVEVLTVDGVRYRGAPTAVEVEEPDAPYRTTLRVDGSLVAPEDVIEFVVRPPGEAASGHRR